MRYLRNTYWNYGLTRMHWDSYRSSFKQIVCRLSCMGLLRQWPWFLKTWKSLHDSEKIYSKTWHGVMVEGKCLLQYFITWPCSQSKQSLPSPEAHRPHPPHLLQSKRAIASKLSVNTWSIAFHGEFPRSLSSTSWPSSNCCYSHSQHHIATLPLAD